MVIKIISGWGKPGGSTIANINLTNLFNENGLECTFYSPDQWMQGRCKSGYSKDCEIQPDDIAILHYIMPPGRPSCKKFILSCHETNMMELKNMANLEMYDFIHFVSNGQRLYHSVNHPSIIIPNAVCNVKPKDRSMHTIAGVIGSVDSHKQTHLSIMRALGDSMKKVLVYGSITEVPYYQEKVEPLIDGKRVVYMGHEDDIQNMYDSVDAVYHSSKRETFNFIKPECTMSGAEYRGLPSAESNATYLSNEEVLDKWTRCFEI